MTGGKEECVWVTKTRSDERYEVVRSQSQVEGGRGSWGSLVFCYELNRKRTPSAIERVEWSHEVTMSQEWCIVRIEN